MQADVQTVDVAFEEHGAAITLGFPAAQAGHAAQVDAEEVPPHVLHSIQSGLASGFQLASAAGPLCDEPMWGVAFEVCLSPFVCHKGQEALVGLKGRLSMLTCQPKGMKNLRITC